MNYSQSTSSQIPTPPNHRNSVFLAIFPILLVAYFLGTVTHLLFNDYLLVVANNIFTIWIINFLLCLMLKIDYTQPIVLFNVFLGTVLVSTLPLSQALVIYFFTILGEKLFKLI